MLETDAKRFRDLMRAMCKLYGQEADEVLFDAYWLALRPWSFPEFEQAAAHLMANNTFMPRPAEFNALRKAGRPTSGEAWLKAVAASGKSWTPQGFTGRASCGDPLIDKAVRALGGYGVIAGCDTDKLHWFEKRFAEIYDDMQDAEDVRESVPMIAGPPQVPKLSGPRKVIEALPQLKRPA